MQHVGAGGQVFPITGTHAYNFPDAIIAPELESSIDQSSFSSYQPVAGPELNNNIYTLPYSSAMKDVPNNLITKVVA